MFAVGRHPSLTMMTRQNPYRVPAGELVEGETSFGSWRPVWLFLLATSAGPIALTVVYFLVPPSPPQAVGIPFELSTRQQVFSAVSYAHILGQLIALGAAYFVSRRWSIRLALWLVVCGVIIMTGLGVMRVSWR